LVWKLRDQHFPKTPLAVKIQRLKYRPHKLILLYALYNNTHLRVLHVFRYLIVLVFTLDFIIVCVVLYF